MASKNYQKNVIDHLNNYKKTNPTLCNLQDGSFRKGLKKYPHILEPKHIDCNLIDPKLISNVITIQQVNNTTQINQKATAGNAKGIHLHQFANHLNSSQMLCINFFAPFFAHQQTQVLLKVLGLTNLSVGISEFEFEHIENGKERTNFDFYFKTDDGRKIYFEIKYTEQEFSRSTNATNASKTQRWNAIYSKATAANPHFKGINVDKFYKNYQILRNLFYAKSPSDFVFFIVPQGNHRLVEQLEDRGVTETLSHNAKVLFWENLITDCIQEFSNDKKLSGYFMKFKQKYLP